MACTPQKDVTTDLVKTTKLQPNGNKKVLNSGV
jgi:hypothetical protein